MQTSEASFCRNVTSGTGEDRHRKKKHVASWLPPGSDLENSPSFQDTQTWGFFNGLFASGNEFSCFWYLDDLGYDVDEAHSSQSFVTRLSTCFLIGHSTQNITIFHLHTTNNDVLRLSTTSCKQKYTGCCTSSCPCWWLCIWIPVSFKVSVWPVLSHGSTGSTRHREQTVTSPLPQALGHPFFSGVTIFKQPFVVDWLMGRRVDSLLLQALLHFLRVQFHWDWWDTCGLAILCTWRGCIFFQVTTSDKSQSAHAARSNICQYLCLLLISNAIQCESITIF